MLMSNVVVGLLGRDETPWGVELTRAVVWPLVVVVAILAFAFSNSMRRWLVDLSARIRKVSALGVDVELSEKVAREVSRLTKEAFGEYRKQITAEFDRLIHKNRIDEKHARLIDEHVRPKLKEFGEVPRFRCTIHVLDVLFTETLYQLIDYYPPSAGPRGRTKSVRFGIVGRAWRNREDQIEAVPPDAPTLIQHWGMTSQEASTAGQGQQSFAAIVLTDQAGDIVGVIYFDSNEKGAFGLREGKMTDFADMVRRGAAEVLLVDAVIGATDEVRAKAPNIAIYSVGEPK